MPDGRQQQTRQMLYGFVCLITVSLCIAGVIAQAYKQGALESNITSLLPLDSVALFGSVPDKSEDTFERNFVLLLGDSDSQRAMAAAEALRNRIDSSLIAQATANPAEQIESLRNFYFPYRYQLLSPEVRHWLQENEPRQIAQQVYKQLVNPMSAIRLYDFADDPFNLGSQWLDEVFGNRKYLAVSDIPSFRKDGINWFLVSGKIQSSPFNLQTQQVLETMLANQSAQYPVERLLKSGLIFHAAEGAHIARSELSTVGLGSAIALVFLVLLVFRRLAVLLNLLLVLAFSSLVAICGVWMIFGRIHLVTLAFGATLLGLAADYFFHVQVKTNALGSGTKARQTLFKGLLIATVSSVLAYSFQWFSPFPALQQFALFMGLGLAAACMSVLVMSGSVITASSGESNKNTLYERCVNPFYQRLARVPVLTGLVLILVATFCGLRIWQHGPNDDIRLLNTSGASLMASEKQVRELLDVVNRQKYFLVAGESEQQVLQRVEALIQVLEKETGLPAAQLVTSPDRLFPSENRQIEDFRLVMDKLFAPGGAMDELCMKLPGDCQWRPDTPTFNPLSVTADIPEFLNQYDGISELRQNQGVLYVRNHSSMTPGTIRAAVLKAAALEGVTFHDEVASLSQILANIRGQVTRLLAGFAACLAIISLLYFSHQGFIVIGAVFLSGLVSLAAVAGDGVSLFHVMALLLVAGIALDAAVFFISPGLESSTWLAASMAFASSLLAFGLLSLSSVPVLHQFGSVVFFGLLTAWIVTPLLWHLIGAKAEKGKLK